MYDYSSRKQFISFSVMIKILYTLMICTVRATATAGFAEMLDKFQHPTTHNSESRSFAMNCSNGNLRARTAFDFSPSSDAPSKRPEQSICQFVPHLSEGVTFAPTAKSLH